MRAEAVIEKTAVQNGWEGRRYHRTGGPKGEGSTQPFASGNSKRAQDRAGGRGASFLSFLISLPMTTSRLSLFLVLAMLATTLTGCELAGDLVKGGIWIGVVGVFIVVALIFWLVTKMGGGNKGGTV